MNKLSARTFATLLALTCTFPLHAQTPSAEPLNPAPAGGRGMTSDEPGALTRVPQGGRGETGAAAGAGLDVDGGTAGGATRKDNPSADPEAAPRTERKSDERRPASRRGAEPESGIAGEGSKSADPESAPREKRKSDEPHPAGQ